MRPRGNPALFAAAALSCALGGEAWAEERPSDEKQATGETRLEELEVRAQRPVSAASSREMNARDFTIRPHSTLIQILNNVPGLVVAQHQGGTKAPQWFLRGFDADHGTDVAVYADDLPINMVTHAHGQGYADPNFLIPETIERVELYKGPYFAQFGDFATAGALKLITRETFEENFALAEGGSFATQRYVLGASPRIGPAKTLFAGQAFFTNGPFINQENLAKYNGMARFTLDPVPGSKLTGTIQAYAADWDASGQIPAPQVASGALPRFGSVDPTEGGRTDRTNVMLDWRYAPSARDTWEVYGYGSRYKLRLWSNFTLFGNSGLRFVASPNGGIEDTGDGPLRPNARYLPGDGIYQGDARWLWGGVARYTRNWFLRGLPMQTQLALDTRNDDVHVTLRRQVRRTSFFTVNDVRVQERRFGGWWSQQVLFTDWLRVEGGLRGDVYVVDVANRLPRQGRDPNFASVFLNGDGTAGLVSPKANLILTPLENTDVYLNFGRGFHSNDARANIVGDFTDTPQPGTGVATVPRAVPLAKALGYELGARTRRFDRLDLAAAVWNLNLESELVFSGDAGTVEPGPSSRRYGVDFEARWQINRWLYADYDLSWVRARFDGGGFVPLAPPLLMNGGLTADFRNGFTVALRGRWLADRPADEEDTLTAEGYYMLDAFAKYRWRNVELGIQLLNLTNTTWREAQFADNSCVRSQVQRRDPNAPCFAKPGRNAVTPPGAIHYTPGNPIGVRAALAVYF